MRINNLLKSVLLISFVALFGACSNDAGKIIIDVRKALVGEWVLEGQALDLKGKPESLKEPIRIYYEKKFGMDKKKNYALLLRSDSTYSLSELDKGQTALIPISAGDYKYKNWVIRFIPYDKYTDQKETEMLIASIPLNQLILKEDRTKEFSDEFEKDSIWEALELDKPKDFEAESLNRMFSLRINRP